ncbi:MAG: dephospho-CoA kinase [Bacteroidales bacterium]|nr:dephospho-CoA kinase [Bacteroidales bacterium]
MIRIGLTGNIGSGKSTVAQVFSVLGVPVYHADYESKKFLVDPQVKDEVRKVFGEHVFVNDQIDRKALADVVFNDESRLKQLNWILHPLVKNDYLQWCDDHSQYAYTIQEAAILIESGFYRFMDYVVVVTAPREIRTKRIMQRDSATRKQVESRMQRQFTEKELKKYAHFVIDNGEKELVIPQVLEIHRKLLDING